MTSAHGFPRLAGGIVVAFGLLIIIAWHAHWRPILQPVPGSAPMQYNTALCFIAAGIGLVCLAFTRYKLAVWFGAVVAGFTFLTLLQYVSGRDFGIDLLFFKPYFHAASSFPGRMSPLAAFCFIFMGAGTSLAAVKTHWVHRLAGVGILSCIVAVIAIVALLGYIFGIEAAYGWGAYSRMAVNTAIIFLLLSIGLLVWAGQVARAENFNFVRWLPVTGSVTLMIMVAFVSALNMRDLRDATFWRRHTVEVLLAAHAYEENLLDMQRGARGYFTLGDTNALLSFQTSFRAEAGKFKRLLTLTSDNSVQQRRLPQLAAAVSNLVSYDENLIAVCQKQGLAVSSVVDTNGISRTLFGNARVLLQGFNDQEQRLLNVRDAAEETDSNNAESLLIFGIVFAALLLVLANYMASRELLQRQRVELRLRDITTLQNAILNSANYGHLALDSHGLVRTFNPAAEKMLGYSAAEVIGKATPLLWCDSAEIAAQAEKMSLSLGHSVPPGIEVLTSNISPAHASEYELSHVRKDGSRFPALISFMDLADETGAITGFLGIIADITQRKNQEAEQQKLIAELRTALAQVKTLSGLIPICGWCKSVRSDQGYWQTVEQYVRARTDATFTHGMCPKCADKMKSDLVQQTASVKGV